MCVSCSVQRNNEPPLSVSFTRPTEGVVIYQPRLSRSENGPGYSTCLSAPRLAAKAVSRLFEDQKPVLVRHQPFAAVSLRAKWTRPIPVEQTLSSTTIGQWGFGSRRVLESGSFTDSSNLAAVFAADDVAMAHPCPHPGAMHGKTNTRATIVNSRVLCSDNAFPYFPPIHS